MISKQSLSAFADSIILDFEYKDYGVRKIPYEPKSYILKVFIVFGGITLSNILYTIKKYRFKLPNLSKIKYIFMPYSDIHYIRFKYIPDIVSEDYLIIYPPAFHIKGIEIHKEYFKNKNSQVLFPKFGFINSFKFLFYALKKWRIICNASNEIGREFQPYAKNSFQTGICMSIIHQVFMESLLKSISIQNQNKILWFFDHDKDYKYISINSEIKKLRKNDTTIHIQHGFFFGNDIAYTYPNADYIFCCNKREQQIISQTITNPERAIIVGAPLQCLTKNVEVPKGDITKNSEYQIIVLLSVTVNPALLNFQKEILFYLKSKKNLSYRLRLRPASQDYDIIQFGDYIDISKISKGKSLSEDLVDSSVVISFSFDALFECFKLSKQILLGNFNTLEFTYEEGDNDIPLHFFKNISEFKLLMESDSISRTYDVKSNTFVRENFGELDFEIVKQNYLNAIKTIAV